MKKNLLVSLADENYIDYVKQLFSSAYWKGGWNGDYMLLAYKVSEEKLKFFREKGIIVKEITKFKANIHDTSNFSEAVLNKFKLFSEEFKKWDTVLFLDVDIVIRYDIKKLKKVKGFNVVSELFPLKPLDKPKWSLNKNEVTALEEIKEKYTLDSLNLFNSGVIAFSTDIIKENTFKDLEELTKKYHYLISFGEQPILSMYFKDTFKNLPRYYNYFVDENYVYYKIVHDKMNSVLLHVFNSNKPWLKESYFYSEWKENYDNFEKIESFNLVDHKVKRFTLCQIIKFKLFFIYKDLYMYIDKKNGKLGILIRRIFNLR